MCDSDDVATLKDSRKHVGLDRRRNLIATELDIAEHDGMKASVLELCMISVMEIGDWWVKLLYGLVGSG